MKVLRTARGLLVSACLLSAAAFAAAPVTVSPGGSDVVLATATPCPTFSWAQEPGATAVKIAVWTTTGGDDGGPSLVLERDLPGGASSWTPAVGDCLQSGATYSWRVAAIRDGGDPEWSQPSWFEVMAAGAAAPPRPVEIRRPASERQGAGAAARPKNGGSSFAVASDGSVTATSFTGDGSGLTELAAASLTGAVALANGGTGADTADDARANLGAAAAVHTHSGSDITDAVAEATNADTLDGLDSSNLARIGRYSIPGGGGSVDIPIPHYGSFQIVIGEAYGSPDRVAWVAGVENDFDIAWIGVDPSGTVVSGTADLDSTTTVITVGPDISLTCPNEESYKLMLTSDHEDVRAFIIW